MKRYADELFSGAGALLLLGGLLANGYVLTLDMVFGPHAEASNAGSFYGSEFLLNWLVDALSSTLEGWVVQKAILLALFFLLLYAPIRFFRALSDKVGPADTGASYVAAAFFACNPFVYERFLAGQWKLLMGYALAAWAFSYYLQISRSKSDAVRETVKLAFLLTLTGIFSLHVLAMSILLMAPYSAFAAIQSACDSRMIQEEREGGKKLGTRKHALVLVAILFSLAVAAGPFLLAGGSKQLSGICDSQWDAFAFHGGDTALGNVTALLEGQGFWLESAPWSDRFLTHQNYHATSITYGKFLCLTLVLIGMAALALERERRETAAGMLLAIMVSGILSLGVSETPFREINLWMFHHVPFWQGFRDTQKWSAVIVACYALLAGVGAHAVICRLKSPRARRSALYALVAIPLLQTPMMIGLADQVKPVPYPESWTAVDAEFRPDQACKAVFLPWHLYYSLSFNNYVLTANPAGKFFHCEIVGSRDMELGPNRMLTSSDSEYENVERVVTENAPGGGLAAARELKNLGVSYVIFAHDVWGEDAYKYPFLSSSSFIRIINSPEMDLYRIQ